jgi:hypothetical protein
VGGQDAQPQRGCVEQPYARAHARYPDFQLTADAVQWQEQQQVLAPGSCSSSSATISLAGNSSSCSSSRSRVTLVDGETKPGAVFAKAFGFSSTAAYQEAVNDGQESSFDLVAVYAAGNVTAVNMVHQGFGYAVMSGARFVVWTSGSVTVVGERIKANHLEVRFSVLCNSSSVHLPEAWLHLVAVLQLSVMSGCGYFQRACAHWPVRPL